MQVTLADLMQFYPKGLNAYVKLAFSAWAAASGVDKLIKWQELRETIKNNHPLDIQ